MKVFDFIIILLFIHLYVLSQNKNTEDTRPQVIKGITPFIKKSPILIGKSRNDLMTLEINASGHQNPVSIKEISLFFSDMSYMKALDSICIFYAKSNQPTERGLFGKTNTPQHISRICGNAVFNDGINNFIVSFSPKSDADLSSKILLTKIEIRASKEAVQKIALPFDTEPWRLGLVLRAAGQDNCDTYRIPGLVTTNNGTLIAVFDNRYKNSSDLQGDIDIGMSRSTDGGQTWEPMKVIIDMNEWGGKPESENGVGDPCILVDRTNNNIWVAGLWIHGMPGKRAWNASQPGLSPDRTGQLILVNSIDDGISWSQPVNITKEIKNPEWYLMFQGPGKGITLDNGIIVFPAQYKDADQIPYSTIIYSKDHGNTWNIGRGAKSNTTEAQCVQLSDKSIMLNMRDNRNRYEKGVNNGRAVAVTADLGNIWTTHPSSNSALPEPVCMASLISTDLKIEGEIKKVLFFSNPDNKHERKNITIKASLDEGMTWPSQFQLVINDNKGYGYSCLTLINNDVIGILYEGQKELYFQKIPVKDILKGII